MTGCAAHLQEDCIARMVQIVRQEHEKQPRTLFVIGAYSIGKVSVPLLCNLPIKHTSPACAMSLCCTSAAVWCWIRSITLVLTGAGLPGDRQGAGLEDLVRDRQGQGAQHLVRCGSACCPCCRL